MTRPVASFPLLATGVLGVLTPGIQPQLLGAAVVDGQAGEAIIGIVAMLELLAMGVAAGGAARLFERHCWRRPMTAAILFTAGCDLASGFAGEALFAILRLLAGLGEGVMIAATLTFIARTTAPGRWSALYLGSQTLAQAAFALVLACWIIPMAGSIGAHAALGALVLSGLIAVPFLPTRLPVAGLAAADPSAGRAPIPIAVRIGLFSVLLFMAYLVAIWVYLEPIGRAHHMPAGLLAMTVPLALLGQVAGAMIAWVRTPRAIGRLAALSALVTGAILFVGNGTLFVIGAIAFGLVWMLLIPALIGRLAAIDPGRRGVALVGAAQLIGSALGPLVAGIGVAAAGPGAIGAIALASLALALVTLTLAGRRQGRIGSS